MKAFEQKVRTIPLDQIENILTHMPITGIIDAIQEGFVAYSGGRVVVPPVGEMLFEKPPGETHIKYGYIKGDDAYVIKIASGFYENRDLGLSPNSGLMLMFSQKTGRLETILLDEGYLTNVRTAAAGAVAARHLAPTTVHAIGILGAGCQGRMQLAYLKPVVPCRDVMVWGRNQEELDEYKKEMTPKGYRIQTTLESADVACRMQSHRDGNPFQASTAHGGTDQTRHAHHRHGIGHPRQDRAGSGYPAKSRHHRCRQHRAKSFPW